MAADEPRSKKKLSRDMIVASVCGAVVALMVGASYAAVPFYNWFCRTTGYGGTTQVAEKAPDHVLDRTLAIRFDSNVTPGLPWKFVPEQNEIHVRIGEVVTVNYKVVNQAAREITAQASYNVSPPQVGIYFNKINCFCFTEQTMKPGETREMAVVFYVDPAIVKDRDQDDLNTITLSYTFYRLPDAARPVAEVPDKSNKL
ncbi:cytochrome c oxidase assembly protein [Pseudolabrys taiwanensis]|uniref:Cytochrome c oxidase assembly protein CtaG n=1 Tax=Pseudolabrys taiwanensis TaxID=331696 RepID=A0A345ZXI8_9HYPH|nr:cytochrome c oxidase assembly protein [Pseudolabrys taiwanensis]AXK81635.1 cytochrome c oxidase assembly protein [Pseudolabrys taiwanensis]